MNKYHLLTRKEERIMYLLWTMQKELTLQQLFGVMQAFGYESYRFNISSGFYYFLANEAKYDKLLKILNSLIDKGYLKKNPSESSKSTYAPSISQQEYAIYHYEMNIFQKKLIIRMAYSIQLPNKKPIKVDKEETIKMLRARIDNYRNND